MLNHRHLSLKVYQNLIHHLNLLNQYNDQLKTEVAKNVKHIQEMQNRLVLGMADMVENRDNSTGGHIKRTSKIVEILVSTIRENNELKYKLLQHL